MVGGRRTRPGDVELAGVGDEHLLDILRSAHCHLATIEEGPVVAHDLVAAVCVENWVHLMLGLDVVQCDAQHRRTMLHCTHPMYTDGNVQISLGMLIAPSN